MKNETMRCSICGTEITDGIGNNPEPLRTPKERCCDDCNKRLVLPARLEEAQLRTLNHEELKARFSWFEDHSEELTRVIEKFRTGDMR